MSPDGETITFDRDSGIFAIDAGGTNPRMLVSSSLHVVIKHDWAPDGSWIVFTPFAEYEQNPNVWTLGTDGTGIDMLTHANGAVGAFAGGYSPDGEWIVFRVENLDRERFRILAMRSDGSDRTFVARMPSSPASSTGVRSRSHSLMLAIRGQGSLGVHRTYGISGSRLCCIPG